MSSFLLIGRISETGKFEESPHEDKIDHKWTQKVSIIIGVNPNLEEARKKALEMDYNMKDGQFTFTARKAFKLYTLRNLGFIDKESIQPPFPKLSVNGRLVLLGVD